MVPSGLGVLVTVGVRLVPRPCGFDDAAYCAVLRGPVQFRFCLGAVGVGGWDVAGPLGSEVVGDGASGDFFHGLDDLEYAGRGAGAEVVGEQLAVFLEEWEGCDVGTGQVVDVHVVAQAGAVGGGVVVSEDHHLLALSEGDLDGDGDEVGFGRVVFADEPAFGGS